MTGLVLLLGVGLLLAFALVTILMVIRLRRPPRKTYAWALSKGVPGEPSECDPPRTFRSWSVRDCPVWEIDGDDPSGPIIVTTPGWGDSRLGVLPRLDALTAHASKVVAWDPPGSGDAPGRHFLGTREHTHVRDIIERLDGDAPVVLFGWSLGAGVSIVAATDGPDRIRAVIAEAPYRRPWTPAFRVMRQAGLPWRFNGPVAFVLMSVRLGVHWTWRTFDRAEFAARMRVPLLVIHGDEDVICPVQDGRDIAAATQNGAFFMLTGAGHNNIWTEEPHRTQAAGAIDDFLRGLRADETPADPAPDASVQCRES